MQLRLSSNWRIVLAVSVVGTAVAIGVVGLGEWFQHDRADARMSFHNQLSSYTRDATGRPVTVTITYKNGTERVGTTVKTVSKFNARTIIGDCNVKLEQPYNFFGTTRTYAVSTVWIQGSSSGIDVRQPGQGFVPFTTLNPTRLQVESWLLVNQQYFGCATKARQRG